MRRFRLRAELIWPAAVLAVVAVGLWFFPTPSGGEMDSHSTLPRGKRAFLQWVSAFEPRVGRSMAELPPLPKGRGHTLMVLGPARNPKPDELMRLEAWVSAGNTLVFAAHMDRPKVDLAPFPVEVVSELSASAKDDVKASVGTVTQAIRWLTKVHYFDVETALVKGEAKWATKGSIVVDKEARSHEELVRLKKTGELQAVRLPVGEGTLVVVASDEVFTNRSLLKGGVTRLLAWRLFEQRAHWGPVHLDEYLNYTGTPQTVGLLFDPLFRPLTLQILLVAVLFGWFGFRRFGPAKPPLAQPRRSIVEHAEALGNLQYRAQAGGHAVTSYLDWWRHDLHVEGGGQRHADLLQRLAAASGRSPAQIHNLLLEASQASQVPMTPARATLVIRELARLRAALRREAKHQ